MRWVDFKYEKGPDFYFCCGKLGHNQKNCNIKGTKMNCMTQFGNYMRTSFPRSLNRKNQNGKEYNHEEKQTNKNQDNRGEKRFKQNLFLTYIEGFHRTNDGGNGT